MELGAGRKGHSSFGPYAKPLCDLLDVGEIQCDQFRSAQRAGKAEQQQRTVTQVGQAAVGARRKRNDAVGGCRLTRRGATPWVRRIPLMTAFTRSSAVG